MKAFTNDRKPSDIQRPLKQNLFLARFSKRSWILAILDKTVVNLNCAKLSDHIEWNRGTITRIIIERIGSLPYLFAHGRAGIHLPVPPLLGHDSPPPQPLPVRLPRQRILEEAQNEAIKLHQAVPVYELRRSRSRRWTLGEGMFRGSPLSE